LTVKAFILKNELRLSKVATVIIFLALIRCIMEPFRLQSLSVVPLTFEQVKPFVSGAAIAAVTSLVNVILTYYSRPKTILLVSLIGIILLVALKVKSGI
jgi:hypothetical protein